MKLKFLCVLAILVFVLAGCNSTKKTEEIVQENAESIETAPAAETTTDFIETPSPDEIPTSAPFDYDEAGEEIFVSVPEDEYYEIEADQYYTDYYDEEDYTDADYEETITLDDSDSSNVKENSIDLTLNDYSDDYDGSEDYFDNFYTESENQVAKNTTKNETTSQPAPSTDNSSIRVDKSDTSAMYENQKDSVKTDTNKTTSSTDTSSNTYVSTDSFYIDYTSKEYSDYSGYDYGDEDYDKLVATFGPNSFPSDKLMAKGRKSAEQLYNYFVSKNPNGDLARAKRLAKLYIEECAIEGVNSDLAFVQMCHETGFLRFGNLVTPDMNNFCGLGSISRENPGLHFETERMGVRAHVQHLHAYGSTGKLKQKLIDPRYKYVKPRGKAPTLAGLTGTWAADKNYDRKIYLFMKELAHF